MLGTGDAPATLAGPRSIAGRVDDHSTCAGSPAFASAGSFEASPAAGCSLDLRTAVSSCRSEADEADPDPASGSCPSCHRRLQRASHDRDRFPSNLNSMPRSCRNLDPSEPVVVLIASVCRPVVLSILGDGLLPTKRDWFDDFSKVVASIRVPWLGIPARVLRRDLHQCKFEIASLPQISLERASRPSSSSAPSLGALVGASANSAPFARPVGPSDRLFSCHPCLVVIFV